MLDKCKIDAELGLKIRQLLIDEGVETPMIPPELPDIVDKRQLIEKDMAHIMRILGLDLTDDSLRDTPRRIAKMYVDEIYAGLNYNNFPKITVIDNKMGYNSMLLEKDISVKSTCEHHFVTFMGSATVAYIPNEKVIGLSKLNRIVEFFSRRPQVQERLTEQIFHTLCYILDTDNVAVVIKAEHFCVKLRGVEDINSSTTTSRLGGSFLSTDKVRNELYQLMR